MAIPALIVYNESSSLERRDVVNGKQRVGYAAAQYVEDGMIVGLGTGSTAYYFIEALGNRVKEEGLQITGVPTSSGSRKQARRLGIKTCTIDEVEAIDLTIDGVDEFTGPEAGIKGGGGALLIEKIIATHSKRVIWIAEQKKHVPYIGAFPLPIEVVTEGASHLLRYFNKKGYHATLREREGQVFVTDLGNYIIDMALEEIPDPWALEQELRRLVGVVETGLFLDMTDQILVCDEAGDVHFIK